MSFAQPWWLLLAGLCLLVLALHLRRRRSVEVSSTYLWRKLPPASAHDARRRLPLLSASLVLQLLLVLALAVALAQPSFGAAARRPTHRIVVLDASSSMQALDPRPSRFEAARVRALAGLEALAPEDVVTLVAAAAEGELLGVRLQGREAAARALERARASDGPVDWLAVADRLRGAVLPQDALAIQLLTDAHGRAAATRALRDAFPAAELEVVALGSGPTGAGFLEAAVRPVDPAAGRWQVAGAVASHDPDADALEVAVWFQPEGTAAPLAWDVIALAPGADGAAPFEAGLELPAGGLVELRLPPDAFPGDDRAAFVLADRPHTLRVLHVGPENAPLLRALGAIEGVAVFRADALPDDAGSYDLVILDRVAAATRPATNTLRIGGTALPGEGAEALLDTVPSAWQEGHPLLESVDVPSLRVYRAARLPRLPGSEALVEASGAPLLQARTTADGVELTLAFALEDSNWTAQASFPIFLTNLMRLIDPALGSPLGVTCQAGRECRLPLAMLRTHAVVLDPGGVAVFAPAAFGAAAGGSVAGAAETARTVWRPVDQATVFRPERAGVHQIVGDEGSVLLPVHAFTGSSEPAGDTASDPAGEAPRAAAARAPRGWPWWRLLVTAGLALLAVEGVVALLSSGGRHRWPRVRGGRPGAGRAWWTLGLYLAALGFLTLAVLDVARRQVDRSQRVVVVLEDGGGYADAERGALRGVVATIEARIAPARRAGSVAIAGTSHVLQEITAEPGAALVPPAPDGAAHDDPDRLPAADLDAALALAAGMLGDPAGGRIVVVSAGVETRGNAARRVPALVRQGIPVDVLPVGGLPPGEVLVAGVRVPERLRPGDAFTLQANVFSAGAQPAAVRAFRDGVPFVARDVALVAGHNLLEMAAREEAPGEHLYEVAVAAGADVHPENDRDGVVAHVAPMGRVAIVTGQADWARFLAQAFESQGVAADVLSVAAAPWTLEGWLAYDTVVLMNVPALELRTVRQELLATYVRDHGGGLMLLGGQNAFGPGGYFRTPLEDVSPVSSRVPRDVPEATLLFVLDRSGSMQQTVGEVSRLEIATEATLQAIELLNEASLTGVVAFDSEATVLLPVQSLDDRAGIAAALDAVRPSGGTELYPALVAAFEQLQGVASPTRHVVVMSDGLSQPGDFAGILQRFREAEITVSTVAIGEGANTQQLRRVAELGNGAFHATSDFKALPSILAQEALLMSTTPVEEVTFLPAWSDRTTPFVRGLPDGLPPLHGYVLTTPKPEAVVSMVGPEGDPILASWRYGLGRVVAFTSHGAGEWSRDWLALDAFPLLWSQAAQWTLPITEQPGLNLHLQRLADEVRIRVDAVAPDGAPWGGLALHAAVGGPGAGEVARLALPELSPGRYEATTLLTALGTHRVEVSTTTPLAPALRALAAPVARGLHVGYPARYDVTRQDAERLVALARATGGRVLLDADEVFAERGAPWVRREPAWRLWTLCALALFLAALTLRYAPRVLEEALAGTVGRAFGRSAPA